MEYNENVEVHIMQRFGELKFSYRENNCLYLGTVALILLKQRLKEQKKLLKR